MPLQVFPIAGRFVLGLSNNSSFEDFLEAFLKGFFQSS